MNVKKSGYSKTPLGKKLGIKNNFRIKLVNVPEYYFRLFSEFPESIEIANDNKSLKDFIHYFSIDAGTLFKALKKLKNEIKQNGMIWISWPKKSSIKTDITEDYIREIALKNGLVDVKVCAIDEVWSGLKLVIPVKDRK